MYVYASISRAKSSSVIVYQLFVYVRLSFTSSWAFRGQRWLLFIFASSMPSIVPGTKYEKCSINVNWMTEWTNFQQISRLYLCPHFVSYPHRDLLVYQKGDKRDSDSFGAHKRMLALFSYLLYKKTPGVLEWERALPSERPRYLCWLCHYASRLALAKLLDS